MSGYRKLLNGSKLKKKLLKHRLDYIVALELSERVNPFLTYNNLNLGQGQLLLSEYSGDDFGGATRAEMRGTIRRLKLLSMIRPTGTKQGRAMVYEWINNDFIKVEFESRASRIVTRFNSPIADLSKQLMGSRSGPRLATF